MVTFQFNPNKDDYVKSLRAFSLLSYQLWIMTGVLLIPMCFYLALALVDGKFDFGHWTFFLVATFFLLCPLLIVVVFFISPYSIGGKVEKQEQLNALIQFEATEDQIAMKTKFIESKMVWGVFQKVVETDELYLLVHTVNANSFHIVPKRAFASKEDEYAFDDLLKKNLPKREISAFNLKETPALIIGVIVTFLFFTALCAIPVLWGIFYLLG